MAETPSTSRKKKTAEPAQETGGGMTLVQQARHTQRRLKAAARRNPPQLSHESRRLLEQIKAARQYRDARIGSQFEDISEVARFLRRYDMLIDMECRWSTQRAGVEAAVQSYRTVAKGLYA